MDVLLILASNPTSVGSPAIRNVKLPGTNHCEVIYNTVLVRQYSDNDGAQKAPSSIVWQVAHVQSKIWVIFQK